MPCKRYLELRLVRRRLHLRGAGGREGVVVRATSGGEQQPPPPTPLSKGYEFGFLSFRLQAAAVTP